jgi:predicted Zn-dependent peptidase
MRKIVIFLVLCFLVFARSNAQEKTMNEEFRKKPPMPLAERPFSISKPIEATLRNGLKIVVFENKRLPIVNFRLCFRSGEINDPPDSIGLTARLAQMLNQGTKTRTSKQFAEEVETIGASLYAGATSDNFTISGSSLNIYSEKLLELMADMVLNPTFPEKELNLQKQNAIEALKFQRSQPGFLADEQVARLIYGKHPYSIVSPKEQDIEKITRQKLFDFHKKILIPNNAILIVVGDVSFEDIKNKIEKYFTNWEKGNVESRNFENPPTRNEVTITVVDRKGSAQANIVISNLAIPRNHPDYFPVLVMNQILGGGASSRLFMNLRESKGYTYGAYSSFDMRRLAGAFEATAEVRTAVVGDALKEFFYEFNRIRNEKVSAEELQDAKNFLTGVFPIRLETQEGLTNIITQQQLFDLPSDYLQTYRDKVNQVTAEDVQRVAQKYILPDRFAIVIVGDAEEIIKQVKSYSSKIEVFDTSGNQQNLADYLKPDEAPTVDVTGKWTLSATAQGQELPLVLILKQDKEKVSGSLESAFGKGEVNGKVKGNKLKATATISFQGQNLELNLDTTVKGDSMNGNITSAMVPIPITVSGKKVVE